MKKIYSSRLSLVILLLIIFSLFPTYVTGATMLFGECNGDVNQDGNINILDVVMLIDFTMDEAVPDNDDQFCSADLNEDDVVNILDAVILINLITGNFSDDYSSCKSMRLGIMNYMENPTDKFKEGLIRRYLDCSVLSGSKLKNLNL